MNIQENIWLFIIYAIIMAGLFGYILYLGLKKKNTKLGAYLLVASAPLTVIATFLKLMHINKLMASALLITALLLLFLGVAIILKPFLSNKSKGQAA